MRALRVVGLTEDGEVVLEDPVRLERFRAPADERLRAAARGDLSRLGQIAIELESQLRPREIQARIRAGASVEQVAAAAGVPEQKIERFAYPVLLERFRTAEVAQRAHPVRAEGPDSRTLADVVAHTFGLRGQEYEGARWDSWKGEDGRWVVALGWRAGRSDNRAHWTFQPGAHGGTVTALDEHASDLVEGLPARPLRTVGAVVDMTRPEEEPPPASSPVEQWRAAASDSYRERMSYAPEAARPAADRGPARTAPEPWRPPAQRQAEREQGRREPTAATDGPAVDPTAVEAPPSVTPAAAPTTPDATDGRAADRPGSAEAVPAAPTGTGTGPDAAAEPADERPTDQADDTERTEDPGGPDGSAEQTAADVPAQATVPAVETVDASPVETVAATPAGTPAPDPVDASAQPQAEVPAARRTRKGKPVMPSWDEVLLGVRGPR